MTANAHRPEADVIRLVGLGGVGRHGVLPEERRDGQTFLVDLDIHLDTSAAAAGDDLGATVDYAAVATEVIALIEGEPVNLLETLAARIADAVLAHERVLAVDVTVHKPEAPLGLLFSDVQVRISRAAVRAGGSAPIPAESAAASGAAAVPGPVLEASPFTPNEGVPAPSPAEAEEDGSDALDREPDDEVAVVLGLGGNVGDVRSTLRAVVDDLRGAPGLTVQVVSPLARTAAVTAADAVAQPDYLNAVVLATTTLSPNRLLELAQSLEDSYGRVRTHRWGQRTVDIDIIDYRGVSSTAEHLQLPHPRANERAFVLVPWAQADADAFLPGLGGGPVAMLAETAPDRGGVRWLALDWLERTGSGTDSASFVISESAAPAPVGRELVGSEQGGSAQGGPAQGEEAPPSVPPQQDDDAPAPQESEPGQQAEQAAPSVVPPEAPGVWQAPAAAESGAMPVAPDGSEVSVAGQAGVEAPDDAHAGDPVPTADPASADPAHQTDAGQPVGAALVAESGGDRPGGEAPAARESGTEGEPAGVPDPEPQVGAPALGEQSSSPNVGQEEVEAAGPEPEPEAAGPEPEPEPAEPEPEPAEPEPAEAETQPAEPDPAEPAPAASDTPAPWPPRGTETPSPEQTPKPFAPRWQPVQRRDEES
ncbi:2-amino-4-hydroxy-6-hydroxymethyldihydropteridine diphosphokinase [Pseudactinotalea sp. Z1748]|uniref:2-amino-4-hydroxy-6- hydroxymethyldihydropteridine diphosphokinase n=1 Tax=Pseudactinotalea sp. Z1748 TaxID=3413027 RepID=UPI003C7D76A1